jgi:uncharacterized protein (TIGR00255 family)
VTNSMTAFARQSVESERGVVTWELRSVNNRFLDMNLRLPDDLRGLEPAVREQVSGKLKRGKVDCNLRFQAATAQAGELSFDWALAEQLLQACGRVNELAKGGASVSATDVLRWPGVVISDPVDVDAIRTDALATLNNALNELTDTRLREGTKLAELLVERCDGIDAIVARVGERMPQVVDEARARVRARLEEVIDELDAARVEQEMVLFCQKTDVAEEMDRLSTHVTEVRRVLGQRGAVGRRLDFLMQELNREANTLGSKSVDTEMTGAAVDLKVLIEQMREQVQNIE